MSVSTIADAANVIRNSEKILVFTGAGMSAESNIPTFRDDEGFWRRFPIEEFATWNGIVRTIMRRPKDVVEFVHSVIQPIASARPNDGHVAVERLERHKSVTVVTQNIDRLHQLAGNTVVHEIHGSLFEVVSLKGRFHHLLSRNQLKRLSNKIQRCKRGPFTLARFLFAIRPWLGLGVRGLQRPNLVLFGDSMAEPDWEMACHAATNCDCIIQVGCSGLVYPAAMIPHEAKSAGARTIAIDPQPVQADHWLQGTAADVLPRLVEQAV